MTPMHLHEIKNLLGSINVIESHHLAPIPRLTCPTRLAELMGSDWTAKHDKWLLEFFGTYMPVYFFPQKNTLAMCPRHYKQVMLLKT